MSTCPLEDRACSGDSFKSEVFKCRVAAAHDLAERACDELAANPPFPSFSTAQLNIAHYATRVPGLNVSSPSMSLYQSHIPIAVEARDDFVSNVVTSSGVDPFLGFGFLGFPLLFLYIAIRLCTVSLVYCAKWFLLGILRKVLWGFPLLLLIRVLGTRTRVFWGCAGL